jgi:hypothetical protein
MAFHRGPVIIKKNLEVYLDASNQRSYNGGTVWSDISQSPTIRNATIVNEVDHQERWFRFNGDNQYMSILQPNLIYSPNEFTIEFAIRPQFRIESTDGTILNPSAAGYDLGIRYIPDSESIMIAIASNADTNIRFRLSTNGSVPIGYWTTVTIVINGLNIKIYINGKLNSEYIETVSIANWTGNWFIGQRGISEFYYFGDVDFIRIYSHELSEIEILNNYNANSGRYIVPFEFTPTTTTTTLAPTTTTTTLAPTTTTTTLAPTTTTTTTTTTLAPTTTTTTTTTTLAPTTTTTTLAVITYLRPISDISAGSWITEPLFEKINDSSPNDSTFITSPVQTLTTFEVGLSASITPITSSVTLRVRARKDNTQQRGLDYSIKDGNTVIQSGVISSDLSTSFTTYDISITEPITNSTTLSVAITATGTIGGAGSRSAGYVSWIELEIQ